MKIPVLIHPKRAAEILGRPESTLRYWRSMGVGPAWIKVEGRVLYDEADLLEYIHLHEAIILSEDLTRNEQSDA
jgi:DNA-binding transcriptional MerR regulator